VVPRDGSRVQVHQLRHVLQLHAWQMTPSMQANNAIVLTRDMVVPASASCRFVLLVCGCKEAMCTDLSKMPLSAKAVSGRARHAVNCPHRESPTASLLHRLPDAVEVGSLPAATEQLLHHLQRLCGERQEASVATVNLENMQSQRCHIRKASQSSATLICRRADLRLQEGCMPSDASVLTEHPQQHRELSRQLRLHGGGVGVRIRRVWLHIWLPGRAWGLGTMTSR